MKRIAKILLATVIVAGSHQARGDDGITGRYWFDNSTILTPFTPGLMEIPTDGLSDGLHMLNAFVEKGGLTSSVSSRWFVKSRDLGASVDPRVHLSVDGKPWDVVTGARGNGIIALDLSTAGIPEGMHLLDATVVIGGSVSSTVSRWFLKTLTLRGGESYKTTLFLDGKPWQTLDTQASGDGVMALQLDMNDVPLGFHTLQAQVVSTDGIPTGVRETMFMRVPSTAQLSTLRGYYVLDGKILGELDASMDGTVFHLDVDASQLKSGLHSVSTYLASGIGITTSVKTAWFVKIPEGGEGVKSYEYWLNDNSESLHTVTLPEVENPFSLVSLIDMPVEKFRSTCYTFALEEGKPVTYARNDFNIRFSDPDGRISMTGGQFTDPRVREELGDIEVIKPNVKTTVKSIADNTMKWYKFDAEIGDSIGVRIDRAAMMELYTPQGEKVLSASGADATRFRTYTPVTNGTYYLAVHDITAYNKSNIGVELVHIPRFAVLTHTPGKTAVGKPMVMTLFGNGYAALKSARLRGDDVSTNAETISVADTHNSELYFTLDKTELPAGRYTLELTFDDNGVDKVVTVADAVALEAADPQPVTASVSWRRIVARPFPFEVRVKNPGNVPYWNVPVSIGFDNVDAMNSVDFKDFCVSADEESDEAPYVVTENLFGTGKKGCYMPILVPYLGPGEEKVLTFDVNFGSAFVFNAYAMAGDAWSEEAGELAADKDATPEEIRKEPLSGIYSLRQVIGRQCESREEMEELIDYIIKHFNNFRGIKFDKSFTVTSISWSENYTEQHGLAAPYPAASSASWYIKKVIRNGGGKGDGGASADDAAESTTPQPTPTTVNIILAFDPNEISGYTSPGETCHVARDVKTVGYTIEFENDPEFATASAHVITVADKLDKEVFDLSSLKMRAVKIGDRTLELDGEKDFVKTIDMRPNVDVIGQVALDYDEATGEANWTITSLDPMSLEPTLDAMQGVLPVNMDGNGIGQILFDIDLKPGLKDGQEFGNSAEIVFDGNEPIKTNVWTNITDYTLPEAVIAGKELSEDGLSCTLTFEGSDSGSGIWYYDLYARAAGAERWELVRSQIEDDTFVYESATSLANTDFAVIATDRAGNRQSDAAINGLAGDADGNGEVDATDVVVTRNYYMDPTTQIILRNADVTVDGEVDAQDATVIRNIYLGEEIKRINNRKPTRRK